jgi:hypothetical protein
VKSRGISSDQVLDVVRYLFENKSESERVSCLGVHHPGLASKVHVVVKRRV